LGRILIAMLALLPATLAENWAVIIAGSHTYSNYRHHADACHAYHIVRHNGIPESNIILLMYDDVANANENPFPGKLFNKPTAAGEEGVDVYKGFKTDYTGKSVTAATFLAVITGDSKTAGGKVLNSTAEDKVFINFVDHGGTGSIMMPNGDLLYAKVLNQALQTMHSNKMYSRLVFYMEACESGSMFEKLLPTDLNIYATTAANGKESSWGTYCAPHGDMVNGTHLSTCLGDLYSVNWMEDSDKAAEMKSETLEAQFNLVVAKTDKSHVQEFGTLGMSTDPIHSYQGGEDGPVSRPSSAAGARQPDQELKHSSAVVSRDIPLVSRFYRYLRAKEGHRTAQAEALIAEIQHREAVDGLFAKLSAAVSGDASGSLLRAQMELRDHECQQEATEQVMQACGAFSDYSMKYARVIVNLCESGHTAATITATSRALCA